MQLMIYKVIQWITWLDFTSVIPLLKRQYKSFVLSQYQSCRQKVFSNRKKLERFSASILRLMEDLVINEDVLPRDNRDYCL